MNKDMIHALRYRGVKKFDEEELKLVLEGLKAMAPFLELDRAKKAIAGRIKAIEGELRKRADNH